MLSARKHGIFAEVAFRPLGNRTKRPNAVICWSDPAKVQRKIRVSSFVVRAERRVEDEEFWRNKPPNFPPLDRNTTNRPSYFSDEQAPYDSYNDNSNLNQSPFKKYSETQSKLAGMNKYAFASIFAMGIVAGIWLDTVINVEPANVASREVIDQKTPNPDICLANGMSAMVLDQRLFISFNPFNVYVSQAEVKPGCVLRQSNWQVLESRGLVTREEVRDCKRNMNTFGFVGDLRQSPEISCIYHSETAENQFLVDPSKAALGDGFQPKGYP